MKKDWEIKKLGDVCEIKQNKKWKDETVNNFYSYIDLTSVDREKNEITNTQNINKENAPSRAQQIIKTGDVLFGTTRPTLKRVCLIHDKFNNQICSTGFCILRAEKNKVFSKWILYQLLEASFYQYIEPLQKGANYPAVTDKDVMNFEFPLPPLAEQKRIVSHLDTIQKQVQQLEEIYTQTLADCEELKQSFLTKAFNGEL